MLSPQQPTTPCTFSILPGCCSYAFPGVSAEPASPITTSGVLDIHVFTRPRPREHMLSMGRLSSGAAAALSAVHHAFGTTPDVRTRGAGDVAILEAPAASAPSTTLSYSVLSCAEPPPPDLCVTYAGHDSTRFASRRRFVPETFSSVSGGITTSPRRRPFPCPSPSYHASRCRVWPTCPWTIRGMLCVRGFPLVYDTCNWRTPSRLEGVDGGVASSSLGGSAAHSDVQVVTTCDHCPNQVLCVPVRLISIYKPCCSCSAACTLSACLSGGYRAPFGEPLKVVVR